MARPKNMPRGLLDPAGGEGGESAPEAPGAAAGIPDPLAGYHYRPGLRGPATTLKPEMVPIIARELARNGVQRIAAAKAGTTEDCLGAWLKRGHEAMRRGKRSIYTELLAACEEAWAHRYGYLIELGERTVTDRHCNPRFITWLMSVTSPKQFTVPREATAASGSLGPAFELVTPEEAEKALVEKLTRFLADEATAPPPPAATPAAEGSG